MKDNLEDPILATRETAVLITIAFRRGMGAQNDPDTSRPAKGSRA